MKIYTNFDYIRRQRRMGIIISSVGLVLGLIAFVVFVNRPDAWATLPLLSVGLVVSLIGTYLINRWVRPPLPEPIINNTFQRSDNKHVLYHHIGPAAHLLLTPKGLLAVKVKRYEGPVFYDAKARRWRGRFSITRLYGHGLTAEGVGNPTAEVAQVKGTVEGWLRRKVPALADQVPVEVLPLFVAPKVDLDGAGAAPFPLARPETLKRQVQALLGKLPDLPYATYEALRTALDAELPKDEAALREQVAKP